MPDLEQSDQQGYAVWWPVTSTDRMGRHVFGDPVEIRVRWIDTQLDPVRPDAQTTPLDAVVIAKERLGVHDLLWRGTLEEWEGVGTGTGTGLNPEARNETDLMQVKLTKRTTDVKGRAVRYRAGCKRYRRLP